MAFAVLVLATIGAFFVAQHLKVTTPLIAGAPRPFPAVINPSETGCQGANRYTKFSFYLLHRADDVAVWVVDQSGTIVRTLASGRPMRRGVRFPDGNFPWDGREDDGRLAPDGTYYFRIALLHQGRTIELTKTPVTIKTVPPRPVVTGVSPALIPQDRKPVTVRFTGVTRRGGIVRIYRTDLRGRPRLLKSFGTPGGSATTWDGRIGGLPAPAGTYLIGLETTDGACNTGRFPQVLPPPPGSTPHAGLTVRYLAAQPPLTPVPAGSTTTVYVDSRHRPYRWTLTRVGVHRASARGAGRSFALHLRLPGPNADMYVLSITSGRLQTAVPLVASAGRRSAQARMLVVLPALTWQGENPVDDDGDGLPDTLDAGGPIPLGRPFANGLPAGFGDEAALLAYLDNNHLAYDLTTDLALIAGVGPALSAHKGVGFAGAERWIPPNLGAALRSYVQGGGHVLSIGIDSLRRGVVVQASRARSPSAPAPTDALGARPGSVAGRSPQLLLVIRDGLGIFSSTSGALGSYGSFQPFAGVAPPARLLSEAGVSSSAASIIGYQLGRGTVVDVGLDSFGSSLAHNADAQELIRRLWTVLSR